MTTYEETKIDQTLERLEIPTTAAGRELSRAERVELIANRLARVVNEHRQSEAMSALHARNAELARIGRLLDDAQVGDTLQPLTMRIQALLREHRATIEMCKRLGGQITELEGEDELTIVRLEKALVAALPIAELACVITALFDQGNFELVEQARADMRAKCRMYIDEHLDRCGTCEHAVPLDDEGLGALYCEKQAVRTHDMCPVAIASGSHTPCLHYARDEP